jgi:TRAP-type C4-dicarboxylate transport system permease small subunit
MNRGSNTTDVFVSICAMISFAVMILLVATPMIVRLSFADKIYPMRPGATLARL